MHRVKKNKKSKTLKNKPLGKNNATNKNKSQNSAKSAGIATGILLMALALFAILSIVSYIVCCVNGNVAGIESEYHPLSYIFKGEQTQNFMGRVGDVVAVLFLKKLFGISSLILLVAIFNYGLKLTVGKSIFRKRNVVASALFHTMLLSAALSIFFHSSTSTDLVQNILPGQFGLLSFKVLQPIVGVIGMAILLFVIAIVYAYFRYNLNVFKVFEKLPTSNDGTAFGNHSIDDEKANVNDNVKNTADDIISENQIVSDENDNLYKDNDENVIPDEALIDEVEIQSVCNDDVVVEPVEKVETIEQVDIEDNLADDRLQKEVQQQVVDNKTVVNQLNVNNVDSVERPEEEVISEDKMKDHYTVDDKYDPTLDLPDFIMPSVSLLNDYEIGKADISDEEIEANRQKIRVTLSNYKIEIQSIKATVGPTITLYEIVPAPGVRIAKIKNLEDDIALSLAAYGIRIIAPMPGRGTIGIEVPNSTPQVVSMRSVLSSKKFLESTMELPIALGKTIQNETFVADLAKMPHLLVAGATGQGKSVGLNAIITSLLYKKHPSQLKFVMVDPKKVELPLYAKLENHYLAKLPNADDAIITDTNNVVNTLNSLIIEMDDRYNLLKNSGVRNIKEYNARFVARRLNPEKGHRFLPYIVVIIDEFADLIMTAGREVETPLARLAQLARAIGIHLIIATQRPSVNIITGTIKANFPARIAFRVVSKIDSRTILDSGGADQLIGRGDMLLSTGSDLTRLQCAFVDTDEVERLTEYIGDQQGYGSALFLPNYSNDAAGEAASVDLRDRDPLFEEAAYLVVGSGSGSTSNIQRKMNLGYNRAGRIMDQLEAAGIVGPAQGSKPRELYVNDEIELKMLLDALKNK